MKAFLSYTFKDNVSDLIELLKSHDVEVLDSMTDLIIGDSLQKATKKAISESDFLVLVYTKPNPNIAFEAGLAVSQNKPILSIVSEKENVPDFLFESIYVNAQPNAIEKIEFNLKILLNQIKPRKKSTVLSNKYYGGGDASNYHIILDAYNILNKNEEKNFEILFHQIFTQYNLNFVSNTLNRTKDFFADFSIWSDYLANILGNPILIEIKRSLNTNNLHQLVKSVTNQIQNQSAESCIVFYDDLNGLNKTDLPSSSKLMFIQISDFIKSLNNADFHESIRHFRNQIAHNRY